MQRVEWDLLLEDEELVTRWRGTPFTGVAYSDFADGTLQEETEFLNGHEDGDSREWYRNNHIKSSTTYREAAVRGINREWYDNGVLKLESIHDMGVELCCRQWSSDGALIRERTLGSELQHLLSDFHKRASKILHSLIEEKGTDYVEEFFH